MGQEQTGKIADVDGATRYPLLHRPVRWDWAHAVMTFSTAPPRDDDVVSTHVVGFVGEGVLLCRDQRLDGWFLPGGTREPGESVQASLERELLEEAGAHLVSPFGRLGAHSGTSEAAAPFRPHLPHPFQAWLWGWAEIEVIGAPANPDDGEQVSEVAVVPAEEAGRRISVHDSWAGELVLLAAERRFQSMTQ